jgi:outer membrane protein TolC
MLRIIVIFSLLFSLLLSISGSVSGQTGNTFDIAKDDISNSLPPLSMLIDSAIGQNATVQNKDLQILINTYNLKSKRNEWTRNVGIQSNTGYGNSYNYATSTSGSIDPVSSIANRSQTQYNASVYLNMPFFTLVDRKNQIRIAKVEIEQSQTEALALRDQIRKDVMEFYNNLILYQRLFQIKVKNLETVKLNMQMIEKQFLNGVIPLTEYTKMLVEIARVESDFETTRMDFLSSYMILELITGMKFNLVLTVPETDEHN